MNYNLNFLRIALILLAFFCFVSMASASPFCPLEWQQEIMEGDFKGHRKHLNWVRDKNRDFIDDSFNELKPGEMTDVIVELNGCQGDIDLETFFSYFGTVVYVGVSVAFVLIEDVPQEKLKELAACDLVAGVEYPEIVELSLDTSTRTIRKHPSRTYSPETFEDAFPGIKGKGVNIAIVDSGVDDEVHAGFAGAFVAGYNALTDTAENPDCDDMQPCITTGPDGICDTVAEPSDEQREFDEPCVSPGPNRILDAILDVEDHTHILFDPHWGETGVKIIYTGPDGICNSNAKGDDYQLIPLGGRAPNAKCILPGPDGTLETDPAGDDNLKVVYHGTHVAGIALGRGVCPGCCRDLNDQSIANNCAGVAPEAGLIDVKVTDSSGSVKVPLVQKALDWIYLDGRADVINMSFGHKYYSYDGTTVLSAQINCLVANDITVVAAAGNEAAPKLTQAASSSLAIAVGSANDQGTVDRSDDRFSFFSNFGPRGDFDPDDPTIGMLKPDITAPGSNICSAQGEEGNTPDTYHFISGTSMAAPHVAGAAALIIQLIPDITPGALKDLLKRTAYQTPQHLQADSSYPFDPIYNINWGYGLLDIYEVANVMAETDMSFTDCRESHPDYPTCRRCLLENSEYSYANSVDIELETDPPVKGEENKITIHVENRGSKTAREVVVCVGVREIGVGLKEFYDVGCKKIASLPPGREDQVEIPWIPSDEDHQCIQATIDYGLDTDFTNNLTQRNVNLVEASSPATAYFRLENPLNHTANIILNLELDDNAQKYLKEVPVTGVPIGEPIAMSPGDCPIMAQIDFLPNPDLPVGTKAKVTVTGKAFSRDFPRGIELSGVTFNYEIVKKSVSYNGPILPTPIFNWWNIPIYRPAWNLTSGWGQPTFWPSQPYTSTWSLTTGMSLPTLWPSQTAQSTLPFYTGLRQSDLWPSQPYTSTWSLTTGMSLPTLWPPQTAQSTLPLYSGWGQSNLLALQPSMLTWPLTTNWGQPISGPLQLNFSGTFPFLPNVGVISYPTSPFSESIFMPPYTGGHSWITNLKIPPSPF